MVEFMHTKNIISLEKFYVLTIYVAKLYYENSIYYCDIEML